MPRPAATAAILAALALAATAGALATGAARDHASSPAPSERAPDNFGASRAAESTASGGAASTVAETLCSCTLRSWVVAGRGRHMFAEIDCPPPHDSLSTVVEFGAGVQRRDFVGPIDPERMPRVAKMTRGVRLRPFLGGDPVTRFEASLRISPDAALTLQLDRMFAAPYVMLGTNSNSGMRAAFAAAGLELPAHVLSGGGVRGEFPGVEHVLTEELPPERWAAFGVPGPEPAPR